MSRSLKYAEIFILLLLMLTLANCENEEEPVGKCVEYFNISGSATILNVMQTEESILRSSGLCYMGYEVVFELSEDIAGLCSEERSYYNHNIWSFYLGSGTPPGPKYLEKYHIAPGVVFPVRLSVQKSGIGPCPPCIIDLIGINEFDYFECHEKIDI